MAKKTKIAWILAEDKAGMLNQALGLGEAVQRKLIEKNVNLELDVRPISVPGFKKYLPNQMWLSGLAGIKDLSGKGFQRPWPDMVISAARKAARPASDIKKKALRDGKDVFAIHIQRPGIDMNNFDIVTCPVHDQMKGDNLIETIGSPGRVSKDKLEAAARDFAEKFEVYKRPLIAVSIGGRSKVYDFGVSELKALADNLRILAKKSDGSLLITASRRSPPETEKILSETLSDCSHYIWDGQGDNPYFGFLGLADYIVVTCDSANMVSEACATGKPVYVFHMQAKRKTKFDIFHQSLEAGGYCRKLGDSLENWRYDPLNETERLADIVISRFGYE